MGARWLVSVPVWGDRYVEEFCSVCLPSVDRAVLALAARRYDVRLVVHTDQPERIRAGAACAMELRPVPAGARGFDCMSQAHREVLALALRGDIVVLLNGGVVISEEALIYCENVLWVSFINLIMCAVPRVLAEGPLPDPADAQGLMRWAWDRRHPMTRECTWPEGRSLDLSRTYFEAGGGVVTRQALPHPLAVRVDGRQLRFMPTVDANLMNCFSPHEIHIAPDCRQLALAKLTPADKGFDLAESSMAARAATGELVIADARQRWCLQQRVILCPGDADPGDYGDETFTGSVRP